MMQGEVNCGYIFTAEELATIIYGLGGESFCGLPVADVKLDVEEESRAVRRLINKNVLYWENERYVLESKFRCVFDAMLKGERKVTITSKNYRTVVYACYALDDGLAVWKFSAIRAKDCTLYITDKDSFVEMLCYDDFLPRLPEHYSLLPQDFDEKFRQAVELVRLGKQSGAGIRIVLCALANDGNLLVASTGVYGSVKTVSSEGTLVHSKYIAQDFECELKNFLSRKE
ncbi:MAG: hypothetical protein LUH08_03945 [Ruminococcus sp.]|nr:hypothetical protein [Ruminococcus sp.]MCD7773192.1 hypothetical protein [Ruminococcus sp.]